jgi:hypothetical protein
MFKPLKGNLETKNNLEKGNKGGWITGYVKNPTNKTGSR